MVKNLQNDLVHSKIRELKLIILPKLAHQVVIQILSTEHPKDKRFSPKLIHLQSERCTTDQNLNDAS